MAMLAEPKRRKKWTLNPRGTLWSKDDSNVGHKLLEKMGWSKGRGLGREEQGDLEPIRLKYKNDAEGVGYEAKDDQWVAHREQFNQILESLNGEKPSDEVDEPPSVKSLEARSKNSRARVHYHKFTRGKDLSRYSASDLASILGKRAGTNSEDKPEPKQEEEPVLDSNGTVQHLHGVTTIHGGSIQEYFAAKMAAVKESRLQNSANLESQQENTEHSEESEKRVRINEDLNVVKEFCSKQKILDVNWKETPEEEVDEGQKKKKKKSKNKLKEETKSTLSNGTSEVGEQSDDLLKTQNPAKDHASTTETDDAGSVKQKKDKKSKKRKMDDNDPPIIADNDCTAEEPKKKKKQKSKTSEEGSTVEMTDKESGVEQAISTNEGAVDGLQDTETSVKKSKKSKKHRKADSTESSEITSDVASNTQELPSQEVCEPSPKKKQKKSAKPEETEPAAVPDTVEVMEKSKKKKKKSEKRDEELPAPSDGGINECGPKDSNGSEKVEPLDLAETTNGEVKKSKKKKKKNKEVEEVQEKYTRIDDSYIEMDSSRVAGPKGEKTKDAESGQIQKDAKKKPEVQSAQSPKAIVSNPSEEEPTKQKKLSNKEKQKHKLQQFEQFKGSNILDIAGYPAWEN